MKLLGIDVGGSGIKSGIVDTKKGKLVSERYRIPTPQPSKPEKVAKVVKEIVAHFNWKKEVGCAVPVVVNRKGISKTRGNIHKNWKGCDITTLLSKTCKLPFKLLNDADAAGTTEMTFGAGKGKKGLVMTITIGTGLGSGVFYDGILIPNFELGRIFHTNGKPIEFYAASSAKDRENLSMKKWSKRFDFFLHHIDRIASPDLFIIGGGISKKFDEFKDHLSVKVPVVVAETKNNAGIIGAAMAAEELVKQSYDVGD
ncbi:MAG: ROK family protein [Bacteroidota bacterium]